jgi:hypothetical protein
LIVDEAHNVAPSGRGRYATDSLRTLAIRTLTPHFEHKLFLTATPHNGYPESFSALLELVDSQRFARGVRPNRLQLEAVMVRRMKAELETKWDGSRRFAKRVVDCLDVDYTEAERRAHKALHDYTNQRLKNASTPGEAFATEFVLKLLKKRMFSSPEAFATTLAKHERSIAGAGKTRPAENVLRRQVEDIEEEYADDEEYEEATLEAIDSASRVLHEPSQQEKTLLRELKEYACDASMLAAWRAAREEKRVVVDEDDIFHVVAKWTGIPIKRMGQDETQRLLTIETEMEKTVIGQREAVSAICKALRRSRADPDLRNRKRVALRKGLWA